jgi:mono/diheme cytochrome c family protein
MILAAALLPSASLHADGPVDRGRYLAETVGGCANCHTPRAQGRPIPEQQFSGGFQTFNEPWFTVKGSNITSDRETGIGAWSDDEILKALTEGVRPNGTPLAVVMPYSFLRILTADDRKALVAFIRSVPPIRNAVQVPNYKAALDPPAVPGTERPMTEADLGDPVKKGFYLATIAHCMACHARRSEEEPPNYQSNYGKGGRVFRGPYGQSVAANITSHPVAGLGRWTDDEIRRALTEGVSRDGRALKPPMADYTAYYRRLTRQDLDAVVAWMRTIPPLE